MLPELRAEQEHCVQALSRAAVPAAAKQEAAETPLRLHVLCRCVEQLEAALDGGASSVIADFQDQRRCDDAVRFARQRDVMILLAAPRIYQPGESDVFEFLTKQRPDGLLVRNLAGLGFCRRMGLPAVADFSLNAVNDLTVAWLRAQGAARVTAAHDLDRRRLLDLAAAVPPEWLEVVVHSRLPMFHSEHCLFCRLLSRGGSKADCGQPCRRHALRLRDRMGVEHPVLADSRCRNTVFHAEAEELWELIPKLRDRGVGDFRVELLAETAAELPALLSAFRRHCGGRD